MAGKRNQQSLVNEVAIGIDLGTTNSCVAVWKNGKVDMIANEQGHRTIPSIVAFTSNGILIGEIAKDAAIKNPEQGIYGFKRLMGKKYFDKELEKDKQTWPFKLVNDCGTPKIKVNHENNEKLFSPEEISSLILKNLKGTAEHYLSHPITKAIITVPAYFNDAQRQATKDAGTIAGLKVIRVLNEPTAAAIAYGWENQKHKHKILVYDLGGGTFDVSILEIDEGNYTVIGTDGDTHLGGLDIDNNLCNYFAENFKNGHSKDIRSDTTAMTRLRVQCENLKKKLSRSMQKNIELDLLLGKDFHMSLSRAKFDDINDELFNKTMEIVERCLTSVSLKTEDIDEIVLVGGSTRIPKIETMLSEFFNKEISKAVNPDEAVAMGAAIQAALLEGEKSEHFQNILIQDVTSLAIGTTVSSGLMSVVIKQNSKIPCEATKTYYTVRDKQKSMDFPIYQGNRPVAADNYELGNFSIFGLTAGPPGQVKVDATFKLDENGILFVTATESTTGSSRSLEINMKKSGLSDEEIHKKMLEAQQNFETDKEKSAILAAKHELETLCIKMKSIVFYTRNDLPMKDKKVINKTCDEATAWIDQYRGNSIDEINEKIVDVQNICDPIIKT